MNVSKPDLADSQKATDDAKLARLFSEHIETAHSHDEPTAPPFIASVFILLAIMGLLGGFMMSGILWPGNPPRGTDWNALAYTPSIMWLSIGIIEAALFAAIAQVLTYLKGIFENGRRV